MNKKEFAEKKLFTFDDLCAIVAILRAVDGCPWDRAQTHGSIRRNLLEEAYEVCEGIDRGDNAILCEELGDVLLQIVFHADIAKSENAFSIGDIINSVSNKMIRRHPHVFGNGSSESTDLQKQWDEIKAKEKGNRTLFDVLSSVSPALPALIRAEKFIEKTKGHCINCEVISENRSKKLEIGEQLYRICEAADGENISPEEALQAFLAHLLTNSINCEQ